MTSPIVWKDFVDALRSRWESNIITDELSSLIDDPDLCVAIWGCLHRQSIDWLYRDVPALDDMRPVDLIGSDVGRENIKTILISNPWW